MISDSVLERAAAISTATLHEAAGRVGALPYWLQLLDPKTQMTGRAYPVTCMAGDNLWIHHALYQCQPGDVLVVDCGRDGRDFGYWGEVLNVAAVARKLAGLVITGGVRDSARLIEMGFPVASGAKSIRGTKKNSSAAGSFGGSLQIGSTMVTKGDLVRADADGVVVIEQAIVEKALDESEKRDAAEQAYFERLRAGETTLGIYNLPQLRS